jgi:hypothetical protein
MSDNENLIPEIYALMESRRFDESSYLDIIDAFLPMPFKVSKKMKEISATASGASLELQQNYLESTLPLEYSDSAAEFVQTIVGQLSSMADKKEQEMVKYINHIKQLKTELHSIIGIYSNRINTQLLIYILLLGGQIGADGPRVAAFAHHIQLLIAGVCIWGIIRKMNLARVMFSSQEKLYTKFRMFNDDESSGKSTLEEKACVDSQVFKNNEAHESIRDLTVMVNNGRDQDLFFHPLLLCLCIVQAGAMDFYSFGYNERDENGGQKDPLVPWFAAFTLGVIIFFGFQRILEVKLSPVMFIINTLFGLVGQRLQINPSGESGEDATIAGILSILAIETEAAQRTYIRFNAWICRIIYYSRFKDYMKKKYKQIRKYDLAIKISENQSKSSQVKNKVQADVTNILKSGVYYWWVFGNKYDAQEMAQRCNYSVDDLIVLRQAEIVRINKVLKLQISVENLQQKCFLTRCGLNERMKYLVVKDLADAVSVSKSSTFLKSIADVAEKKITIREVDNCAPDGFPRAFTIADKMEYTVMRSSAKLLALCMLLVNYVIITVLDLVITVLWVPFLLLTYLMQLVAVVLTVLLRRRHTTLSVFRWTLQVYTNFISPDKKSIFYKVTRIFLVIGEKLKENVFRYYKKKIIGALEEDECASLTGYGNVGEYEYKF